VHEYLIRTYSSNPFSAVIDAVGVQTIFDHSPKYLSAEGSFVSVGVMSKDYSLGNMLHATWKIAMNLYWPRLFGGVPRPYIQKTASVDSPGLEALRDLLVSGHLKVIQDSTFQLEDALKVSNQWSIIKVKSMLIFIGLRENSFPQVQRKSFSCYQWDIRFG
jgi:NADPH:quinone reductase-like Zn-dependent oxidoreductase